MKLGLSSWLLLAHLGLTAALLSSVLLVQEPAIRDALAALDPSMTPAALDEAASAATRPLLAAMLAGLLAAGAIALGAARAASSELREVAELARRLADGERPTRGTPRGPAELVELSVALQRLAEQLHEQQGRVTIERDLSGAVLDAMAELVLVLEPDGTLVFANASARHGFAIARSAAGLPLVESIRNPALLDAVGRAAAGAASNVELALAGPPRRELAGRAARLPDEIRATVVVVLADVTERRRLEAVRRDFVTNASHELRTPVAAIRGFAETLEAGALDDRPAAERFVAGIARQSERLQQLVNDLLDLSRIESGTLKLTPEVLPVARELQRLADLAEGRARSRGLRLAVEPEPAGLRVRADPRALDMCLGNLLDNAVKYCSEGGEVRLSATPEADAIRFEVRDSGPGIEPEHLPRLFERFYRVDAGRSRQVGGTGLGLSIAKNIALQSGGDVGVTSRPGVGSTFWMRLPKG